VTAEQQKISWNTAERYINNLVEFKDQMPWFSEQEIMQAHALQNIIISKRQTCFKQADI
jgi:hypothetical protein